MRKKSQPAVRPVPLDVTAAREAFARVEPRLSDVPRDELVAPRVDVQAAAAYAFSLAARDSSAERRARLSVLDSTGLFRTEQIEGVQELALACFHARRMTLEASFVATGARIPEPLLREAQERRGRMLRVLAHYFDGYPTYATRLDAIRSGVGYQDLANDLLALRDDYLDPARRTVISRDPVHYRADDAERAGALARELFAALGLAGVADTERWVDATQRSWALLTEAYDALRAAGRMVFQRDEDVEATYPSLVSAVRANPTATDSSAAAATDAAQPAS